jgi:DNA-binding Lrp family transcriptional regulator
MTGVKIDEINANILRALLADARTSLTDMSKENDIAIVSIRSRYEKLKQMGVIKGAIMQINPCCLGLNCTGFLRLGVKPEKSKEVREFLEKEPYILSTWNRLQEINVGAFFAMPDLQYFNTVKDRLRSHPHIEGIKPLIYVGFLSGDHPENLIIKTDLNVEQEDVKESDFISPNLHNKTFVETPELQQMNPIDRNIAKMLSDDARTSFRAISKELKLSTTNVIKRYGKLRKNEMFVRSTIAVDLRKLGYKGRVMIYFNIKQGTNISELQKRLLSIPNLIVLIKTIGETDMLAIIPITTLEEYFELKATLSTINEMEVVQINITSTIMPWPHNFFAPLL